MLYACSFISIKRFHEDKKQLCYNFLKNPHIILPSLLFISMRLKRPLERSFLGNIALWRSIPCFCCTKTTQWTLWSEILVNFRLKPYWRPYWARFAVSCSDITFRQVNFAILGIGFNQGWSILLLNRHQIFYLKSLLQQLGFCSKSWQQKHFRPIHLHLKNNRKQPVKAWNLKQKFQVFPK